ncbi:tetratricopeptide repeat protein [Tamilnaduibacter salinus]|uniref:Tetratricopeptide repeat protein n=1 Tax=Tamilnaduibacter salinus TaxID=1484056 RepID=A0A2A2I772_9GAMM|nr:tetratricopeptide repeat protein [Tamilnaduibacter salinus]PAV27507.1 hypothetical protein CF392_00105 [Tamilnaduibacter salinus]PVY77046.1 tetratricopeptide repeat protein [Tamilnaduibacter salinus]
MGTRIGGLILGGILLAGCAGGPGPDIYVPAQRPVDSDTSSEAQGDEPASRPSVEARSAPSHQSEAPSLSPAAVSLIRDADRLMRNDQVGAAIGRLERAQRISPRSAEVYYRLAHAYRANDQLGRAEQFALRGLSLTGDSVPLQRTGWSLLADIRRSAGDMAGAEKAQQRARAL